MVPLLMLLAVGIGYAAEKFDLLIPLGVAVAPPLVILIGRDLANFSRNQEPSKVLPLLILGLPFYNLFLVKRGDLVWQCVSLAILLIYFFIQPTNDRILALRRARPLLIPVVMIFIVSTFSVIFSDVYNSDLFFNWFVFASSIIYLLLACLYCRTMADVYRLMAIIVLCGLLQFPIFIGQATGLTNKLPGGLAQLSSQAWGGAIGTSSQGARYPGSFSDYELVAEYLAIAFLFGLGLFFLQKETKWKIVLVGALGVIFVTAIMTGTRGFVAMILIGALIILYGKFKDSGRFFSTLFSVALLVLAILVLANYLLPEVQKNALMSRLALDQIFTGGNLLNRQILFTAWLRLLPGMPFWGFGNGMRAAINSVSPFGPIILSPHSLYFAMLLTYGYLGLVAILSLILGAVILLVRTILKAPPAYQFCGWILLAVMLAWVADEIKIDFVRYQFYIDFVYLLFGMISCVYSLSLEKTQSIASKGT